MASNTSKLYYKVTWHKSFLFARTLLTIPSWTYCGRKRVRQKYDKNLYLDLRSKGPAYLFSIYTDKHIYLCQDKTLSWTSYLSGGVEILLDASCHRRVVWTLVLFIIYVPGNLSHLGPTPVSWLPLTLTQNQLLFSVTWGILDVEMGDGRLSWRLTATRYAIGQLNIRAIFQSADKKLGLLI